MSPYKIAFVSLGCAKNLVNTEQMMALCRRAGHTVTGDPDGADVAVLNTCGFIDSAKSEAIQNILELAELKKEGKLGKLLVTGCLSQRYQDELMEELPEVDGVMGTGSYTEIVPALEELMAGGTPHRFGDIDHTEEDGARIPATPSYTAYLKIAEGCDRTCSYCAIPISTGRYQSIPMEEIEKEVRLLVKQGVKEFQVIAQDLTYYGLDLYKRHALPELVERISDIPGVEWIRLHYGYPSHFPYDLLRVMSERDNVCKYMDIALQHISDPMLKKMRRNITKEETYALIRRMREEVPGIHLRTTLMVGHPGETEQDFEELVEFVKEARFERMGAFAYSHEEGTYSFKHYTDDIDPEVKQDRLDYLMRIQEGISAEVNGSKIGKVFKVMIDREEEDFYVGRTEFDSPEVDPEILVSKEKLLIPGMFYNVRIDDAQAFDLYGSVL